VSYIKPGTKLLSTISSKEYNFSRLEETAENNEPLEVFIPDLENAVIRSGEHIWQRFADFLPFQIQQNLSLGEGNTPLLEAHQQLKEFTGLKNLMLKNETLNPTGSFKDRGSLLVTGMCHNMGENLTATISTGNMGCSISAYGSKAGINVIVFVPDDTPDDKLKAIMAHGQQIIKVKAPDYSQMKKTILSMAGEFDLRIVSGNGPVRTEGYKLTAFELYEQMNGEVPDYIAVPTSACGHIRGLFKGYLELQRAGLISRLPKMIVVQAENNSPIVSAVKLGKNKIIPFRNINTVAHAITSGEPFGGNEIIHKVGKYNWPVEDVSEAEIICAQKFLLNSGISVEAASATSLSAVKKLREKGLLDESAKIILMITGSGTKELNPIEVSKKQVINCTLDNIKEEISNIMKELS